MMLRGTWRAVIPNGSVRLRWRWSAAAFRRSPRSDTVPARLDDSGDLSMSSKPACNPRTIEEARAFVARVESLFMPWNIPALLAGFTEDCVVRFGDMPEFRGRSALERLFRARSERQKGYRLRKQLRGVMGDTIANYWEGEWEDRMTGVKMAGRGVEIWTMRDGKIAVWEAAFNANEIGKPSVMELL